MNQLDRRIRLRLTEVTLSPSIAQMAAPHHRKSRIGCSP